MAACWAPPRMDSSSPAKLVGPIAVRSTPASLAGCLFIPNACGGLVMKLRLSDGAELFYTIDDYTDPWTQPETVVLHHGMAKNHQLWYAWIPILAQHYRVVRFDMRGMGQSS